MKRGRGRRSLSTAISLVVGLAAPFFAMACGLEITAEDEVIPERFSLTITVTNVGNGFGQVDVVFPAGTVQNSCPEALGPGMSCTPKVKAAAEIESVDLDASARLDSQFSAWGGACAAAGASTECTVTDIPGDYDKSISVEVQFDLLE